MKLNIKSLQVSCDGGAATGKSTGAKMVSKKYRLQFLSSGLLYRYASYLYLKQLKHIQEVAFFNDEKILNVIKKKGMWWVFYYNDCKILSLL